MQTVYRFGIPTILSGDLHAIEIEHSLGGAHFAVVVINDSSNIQLYLCSRRNIIHDDGPISLAAAKLRILALDSSAS
jgi:hypothetical protein